MFLDRSSSPVGFLLTRKKYLCTIESVQVTLK